MHSLLFKGPEDKAPKTVKVFINQPSTLDFDKAEGYEPTQKIDLSKEDITVGVWSELLLPRHVGLAIWLTSFLLVPIPPFRKGTR